MAKKIITQQDLDNNPDLIEKGIEIGDEIIIPEPKKKRKSKRSTDEDDDTGGSAPPPGKGRG